MTCHCFLRPIRRDLTSSPTQLLTSLFTEEVHKRQRNFLLFLNFYMRRRVHLHLTKLVTWSNRYEGERTRIFSTTFSLPSPSSDLKVANDGEKGKPFNIFQKVAIRKTRCHYIWEKSTFWKLGFFFTSSPHETTAGRTLLNQLLALYSFYTWFLTFRDAQQGELS